MPRALAQTFLPPPSLSFAHPHPPTLSSILPHSLQSWGEDWQVLQKAFEEHRAGWLDRDRAGWLACNKPYPGIVDALAACEAPYYIASRWASEAHSCRYNYSGECSGNDSYK